MVRYLVIVRTHSDEKDYIIRKSLLSLKALDVDYYYFRRGDTQPNGTTFQTHRYDYIFLKLYRLFEKVKFDFTFWIWELYDGTQCSKEKSFEELLNNNEEVINFYKRKGLL